MILWRSSWWWLCSGTIACNEWRSKAVVWWLKLLINSKQRPSLAARFVYGLTRLLCLIPAMNKSCKNWAQLRKALVHRGRACMWRFSSNFIFAKRWKNNGCMVTSKTVRMGCFDKVKLSRGGNGSNGDIHNKKWLCMEALRWRVVIS